MSVISDRLMLKHSREVAHMRVQLDSGRFGLVLGAGVSKPLKFPGWGELVQRIASDSEVSGTHILATAGRSLSDTTKTQMLFLHFRAKCLADAGAPLSVKLEREIQGTMEAHYSCCAVSGRHKGAGGPRERTPLSRQVDIGDSKG